MASHLKNLKKIAAKTAVKAAVVRMYTQIGRAPMNVFRLGWGKLMVLAAEEAE